MLIKTGVTVFTGQTLNTSTDVFCRNGKAEMAGCFAAHWRGAAIPGDE
jgi:hypothetical protein